MYDYITEQSFQKDDNYATHTHTMTGQFAMYHIYHIAPSSDGNLSSNSVVHGGVESSWGGPVTLRVSTGSLGLWSW